MAHELHIADANRVNSVMEDIDERLAKLKWTVETAAGIGSMGLPIGKVAEVFSNLEKVADQMGDACRLQSAIHEDLSADIKRMIQQDEDFHI